MSHFNLQSFLNNAARRPSSSFSMPLASSSAVSPAYGVEGPKFSPIPSKPSIGQDESFQKVCNFLKDDKVGKVGVYGMGGVGKTTLIQRIYNEHLVFSDFDIILYIPMSKDSDYQNIWRLIRRSVIIKWFHLPLSANQSQLNDQFSRFCDKISSKPDKGNEFELFQFLLPTRFALVMDDIWEYVDLIELGIPNPTEENKCKVIFSTRSEETCRQMNPDAEIKVGCLGPIDSWTLFEQNVGNKALHSHPGVASVAQKLAEQCGGLPLALIILGRAMSSKYGLERWEHALLIIKNNPYMLQSVEKKLFLCLKFSYNALENDATQQCFLYCSLFPEGYGIEKERLIGYWMGEGYLGILINLKNVKNRGYEIIGRLESACLLESYEEGGSVLVKMHGVIRGMALWIVSNFGKDKDKFYVHRSAKGLTTREINEKWASAQKIFVMDKDNLPDSLSNFHYKLRPRLSTLIFDVEEVNSEIELSSQLNKPHKRKFSDPSEPQGMPIDRSIEILFSKLPELTREVLRVIDFLHLPIPTAITPFIFLQYLGGSYLGGSSSINSRISPWSAFPSKLRILHIRMNARLSIFDVYRFQHFNGNCQLDQPMELKVSGVVDRLPERIGDSTMMENLFLSNSRIQALPYSIEKLVELRQLDVGFTQLESLPIKIGRLTNLEMLDLQSTLITSFPATIGQLVMLKKLNLTNSRLETLPPSIGQLTALTELYLAKTRITMLPVEIGSLTKLVILDLGDTGIAELPSTMAQLVNLKDLNLEGTKLKALAMK